MPDVVAHKRFGPDTFVVNATVDGGQLVEPDTGGLVKVCTADSLKCLGVALFRAEPAATTGVDTVYGYPRVGMDVPRSELSVASTGTFKLTASGTINFGDLVVPAASGAVKALANAGAAYVQAEANATRAIVGVCVEPLGIASGQTGRIRLKL